MQNMTSEEWAYEKFSMIDEDTTVNEAEYYGAEYPTPEDHGTSHCSIISSNGDAVALTSTVNTK